jgi:deoxyribodipyrimidine photo-lyase
MQFSGKKDMIKNLCWVRRDLRLHDHHALSAALKNGEETYVVFIFDNQILNKLSDKKDKRITLIMDALAEMEEILAVHGSSLIIRFGDPKIEIPKLVDELKINALYFNRDYEPYAKARDSFVEKTLLKKNIEVHHFKDHVIFEKNEVLTGSREVYKVFTPYKNKWLEHFRAQESVVPDYKCNLKKLARFQNADSIKSKDWNKEIGFSKADVIISGGTLQAKKKLQAFKKNIDRYKEARDIPSLNLTSMLSPYIRFGNISIRDMIRAATEADENEGSSTWLSEIIWRDFYQVILDVYPKIETHCFKQNYDQIKWIGKKEHFELWCIGQTGYPIVDAAMRCLNETGFMHNRLRMVVASFLTKTLLIDWRAGEKYFAEKLLDYDLAANNGGWQWSASTGVDAQPYFRIFNPYNQSEKFDEEGKFIKIWCPELKGFNKKIHYPHEADMLEQAQANCVLGKDYPFPIVAYKVQKEKALLMFKAIS